MNVSAKMLTGVDAGSRRTKQRASLPRLNRNCLLRFSMTSLCRLPIPSHRFGLILRDRQDVAVNGSINATDVALVKSRSGQSVP